MIIQDVQVPQMIFASLCQDTKCVLDREEFAVIAVAGLQALFPKPKEKESLSAAFIIHNCTSC